MKPAIRKTLSLLLVLLLTVSLLPALSASAETDYRFMVGGISVASANAADILGDGLFSYEAPTNTLTVKGSKDFSVNAVVNNNAGLTIFVANDATLTSSGCTTLLSFRDFTVTGPGKLTLKPVNSTKADAVYLHAGTMTLEDANVQASGVVCGIEGDNTAKLVVRNSFLTASGDAGGIAYLADLTVEGCKLITPSNGRTVSSGVLAPEDAYETYAPHARIEPIRYDLWVCGNQVAEAYRTDFANGFSYDPATKTLSVKNSCFSGANMIVNDIQGLTIYVENDVTFECGSSGILTGKDLRITGPGRLRVISPETAIFVTGGSELTIQDAELVASGVFGITGGINGDSRLTVKNSAVYAEGSTAAISDFRGGIALEDAMLTVPADGIVSGGSVTDQDGVRAKTAEIARSEEYSLKVGGTQVSDANAADVLGNGLFSYDAAANRLTVKGSWQTASDYVIENRIPHLTVYAAVDATLSSDVTVIATEEDLTITGPGRLTLKNGGLVCGVWVSNGAALTIENARVDATGKWGVTGDYSGEQLLIRDSEVHAAGPNGALCDFAGIVLEGCGITAPAGGKLSESGGAVLDKDGNVAADVTVGEAEAQEHLLWIDGVQVTDVNAADVLSNGVFSYDAAAKLLTLKGGYTAAGSQILIHNWVPGLTIRVAADSVLNAEYTVIHTSEALTFTGPGRLTAVSGNDCAIYATHGAALTLDGATVEASGVWGVAGNGSGERLVVRGGAVHAKGSEGAVCDFDGGVTLVGCAVTVPAGGAVKDGGVVDKDGHTAVEVSFGKSGGAAQVNPFADVFETDLYYPAVLWAYYAEPQVTNGMDATHFGPDSTVTRGQAVTFLWRAMGCPEPKTKTNPFTDVEETAYYYKPILWAVETGVTRGTDETHFTPDQTCSTAHIITFLYRTLGLGPDGWYEEAADWARGAGLLEGLTLKVEPGVDCPRAYVVLFLYRQLAEETQP